MTTPRHFNNTSPRDATLLANISALTADLNITPGLDDAMPDVPFSVRITDQNNANDYELATCTAKPGGGILTVTRNYGGTTAIPRNAGDIVTAEATAEDFDHIYGAEAEWLIASVQAADKQKEAADYVCDGIDDQEQLQAVFDDILALPTYPPNEVRATIRFTRGQFLFTDGAEFGNGVSTQPLLVFRGEGPDGNTEIRCGVQPTTQALIYIGDFTGHVHEFHDLDMTLETVDWAALTTPIIKVGPTGKGLVRIEHCKIQVY